MAIDLDSYIDVAARIAEFRAKHPDGSLRPADPVAPYRVEKIGEQIFIVVAAAAYRTPDDPAPGVGLAYELVPGKTPYTKGSELQNAQTAAWGRAIVASLAADTRKGIASGDEVRNRDAERNTPVDEADEMRREIRAVADENNIPPDAVMSDFRERTQEDIRTAGVAILTGYLTDLRANGLRTNGQREPAEVPS